MLHVLCLLLHRAVIWPSVYCVQQRVEAIPMMKKGHFLVHVQTARICASPLQGCHHKGAMLQLADIVRMLINPESCRQASAAATPHPPSWLPAQGIPAGLPHQQQRQGPGPLSTGLLTEPRPPQLIPSSPPEPSYPRPQRQPRTAHTQWTQGLTAESWVDQLRVRHLCRGLVISSITQWGHHHPKAWRPGRSLHTLNSSRWVHLLPQTDRQ